MGTQTDLCLGLHSVKVQVVKMAKSKNHTNHNQNKKNHRNGIRKPKTYKKSSLKGVDPKYLRNLKVSNKLNKPAHRKKIERMHARQKGAWQPKSKMVALYFVHYGEYSK